MAVKENVKKKKENNVPAENEEIELTNEKPPVPQPAMVSNVLENMNSKTKAAAVLIALGEDSASEVVKYRHEGEVESLSAEIAQINSLSAEEKDAIINEFYEMCIAQKAITEGGLDYAKSVLKKAFGDRFYEIIVGGAAFNHEVEMFLKSLNFPFTVGYGATECAPIICYSDYQSFVPGSCG